MKNIKTEYWLNDDQLEELFQDYYNESDLDEDRWICEEEFIEEVVTAAKYEAIKFLEAKKCGDDNE